MCALPPREPTSRRTHVHVSSARASLVAQPIMPEYKGVSAQLDPEIPAQPSPTPSRSRGSSRDRPELQSFQLPKGRLVHGWAPVDFTAGKEDLKAVADDDDIREVEAEARAGDGVDSLLRDQLQAERKRSER